MREVFKKDEGAEVGVDGYDDAPRLDCPFEKLAVSRIGAERTGLDDIVPLAIEPLCQASTGAAIDQKPHTVATRIGANESLAITACA